MNFDWKSRVPLLIGSLLVLLTLAAYWPALNCGFINYDDHQYVVGNPRVHTGLSLENCRWAFNIGYASNWHPLTWLSHMADCQLFGLDPRGHHLMNLIFHLANTLLLFGVLCRMTRAVWPSAMVAALFAWHPAHVESVAWVAERKDLLSTFFFLLTLGAYYAYAQRSAVGGPKSRVWYGTALLLFVLGLMSKPMLVTLPFVLLLLDYWPLNRCAPAEKDPMHKPFLRLLPEKLPFFALAAASCVVTLIAQKRGGAVVPMEVISLDARGWNAVVSYLRYVGKLFWPHDLAVIYPYVYGWPGWLIGLAVVFLLGASWLAILLRRSAPYLPVGWFWFLGALVPVIGLVQVGEQAMADRYTYIPSIGLFMVVCWAVPQLPGSWPLRRPALVMCAMMALAACATATRLQLQHWRTGVALFEHALAVTQRNPIAHATLGLALMDEGKLEDAVAQYEAALQISPNYSLAHNNMGVALARLGRFDQAIVHYRTALQFNPRDPEAHFNLATAFNPSYVDTYTQEEYSGDHRTDAQQAREHYQTALALNPGLTKAYVNWGNLELAVGNPQSAIRHYQDALLIDPLTPLAHLNLGNALAKTGATNEAISAYTRAVEIEPGDALTRLRLANLLASQAEFEKAIPHYQQAIRLDPGHFAASSNLGSALAKLGRYQEAAACFAEAIRIQPGYADAHVNMAKLLAEQGDLDGALKGCFEALRLRPNNPELHRQAALWLSQQGKLQEAAGQFAAVAKLTPAAPGAHYDLGVALVKLGKSEQAVKHFKEALRLKPSWVQAINNLAWILATHEKEQVRNGPEAVSLATRACVLSSYNDARVMGTLAAAYAEAGRFPEAVAAAEQTCELALAAGDQGLAEKTRARLKLYQAGRSCRETGSPAAQ
ncbi:MAG TPA: tetratricopeptide repeat protein [Candidatus Paceibacterota bacterium]|nr:tetratricopeptide repeat protein [Verrucomicrobiota bacterium]HSA11098.1 tetratricopeptide repeat protein [Candidatus Paceibacterota bacterium]